MNNSTLLADLTLMYLGRLVTVKGDEPGHPFRGNQYSEGGGVSIRSGSESDFARALLIKTRAETGSASGVIRASHMHSIDHAIEQRKRGGADVMPQVIEGLVNGAREDGLSDEQIQSVAARFKGDTPGHPFRGNQYDGGSGGGAKLVKDMTQEEIVGQIHTGIVDKLNKGIAIPMGSYTGGAVIKHPSSIRLSQDKKHIEVTRRDKKTSGVKWDVVSDNTLDNWASKLKVPGLLDWEMAKSGKGDYANK